MAKCIHCIKKAVVENYDMPMCEFHNREFIEIQEAYYENVREQQIIDYERRGENE